MKRKKIVSIVLALILALLPGCGRSSEPPEEDEPPIYDLPVDGLHIQRAQNFHIQYLADGVKLLIDSAGRELLLVPEGVTAPSGYEDAVRVSTPVRRVMFTASSQLSFLGELGEGSLYDSIAAVTEEIAWWIPQVAERRGQIAHIVPETWIAGDAEGISAAAPDLVITDMTGESGTTLCALLDGLGIQYAVAAEGRDINSEAYMEWLKFFSAFYNLDQQADDLYQAKVEALEKLYTKGASVPEDKRPVVAVGRADGGIVYTQGGDSVLARQLARAGAVYALEDWDGEGVIEMGMEEFLDRCGNADILIYDTQPMYMPGTLLDEDPLFAEFKAYQNQRVYAMANSYYLDSAKVVEKFADLLAICHPELEEGHIFSLYQPLLS